MRSLGLDIFSGDLSLQKNFPIRESIFAQFRVDAFNGFNHINPANPSSTETGSDGNINSEPALGIYTNPRQMQFSLRVQFWSEVSPVLRGRKPPLPPDAFQE